MGFESNDIVVMVPIRGLTTAMTRLREDLPQDQVNDLVKTLFSQTISITLELRFPLIVVTPDPLIQESDFEKEVTIFRDDGSSLNQAIFGVVDTYDFDKYLLVMPDLPGLQHRHLGIILKAMDLFENLIFPTKDGGTAIALLEKKLFQLGYLGPKSSEKIINYAHQKKLPITKMIVEELSRDLDTINDWNYWYSTLTSSSMQS